MLMIAGIFVFHAGTYYGFTVPDCGHTCVAIFFFLSGFGLEYSLMNKKGYMHTFLQKRVLGLLFQYWIVMILCAVMTGIVYMSWDIILNDIDLWVFEYVNWYILELLTFYILFFLSTMIRSEKSRILFLLLSTIFIMYVFADYYQTNLYYKSGISFFLGIIWFRYENHIKEILERFYAPLLVILSLLLLLPFRNEQSFEMDMILTSVTSVLTCVVTCLVLMADLRRRWYIPLSAMVVGILFVWFGLGDWNTEGATMLFLSGFGCVMYQLPILAKYISMCGAASLELFLLHYSTFQWASHYFDNLTVMMIFSVAATATIAYVAYRITGYVVARYNRGVDRISNDVCPKQT